MHIIVCTDNSAVRQIVYDATDSAGRSLTTCESGMELLAAVKALVADLVILDLETHGLGALLLVSAVKELAPDLPIVAVSMRSVVDTRPLLQKGIPYVPLGPDADGKGQALFAKLVRQSGLALSLNPS